MADGTRRSSSAMKWVERRLRTVPILPVFLAAALLFLSLTYLTSKKAIDVQQAEKRATSQFRGRLKLHGRPVVAGRRCSGEEAVIAKEAFVFFYGWYGNPEFDGKWIHWNHEVLESTKKERRFFEPPRDVGSSFVPELGFYSSKDISILRTQMRQMLACGIGTMVVSWWGRSTSDQQGGFTNQLLQQTLDTAAEVGLKVAIHLEPYENRSAKSVMEDLIYLEETYFDHSASYKYHALDNRPLVFIYDSYIIPEKDWHNELSRRTGWPSQAKFPILIGLLVNSQDAGMLDNSLFDGYYTYFAADGFTQGSTVANWNRFAKRAIDLEKLFIPCVGPGYDDIKIRPWNSRNQRDRKDGAYYSRSWDAAFTATVNTQHKMIGITSWNEWHEGTGIEPVKVRQGFKDYLPHGPDFYLKETREWITKVYGECKES